MSMVAIDAWSDKRVIGNEYPVKAAVINVGREG